MTFYVLNDMGGQIAAAQTALELRTKIPANGKIKANGLVLIDSTGTEISKAELDRLCAIELMKAS